jgi:endonuclease/exonuclease/phosphatase family metal-dependent hydrolase
LASPQILGDAAIQNEPRILLGDFNEKFGHSDVNRQLKPLLRLVGGKSWPAPLPFVDLDRIYFSGDLRRVSAGVHRWHGAMIASDHLPLVAVLEEKEPAAREAHSDAVR